MQMQSGRTARNFISSFFFVVRYFNTRRGRPVAAVAAAAAVAVLFTVVVVFCRLCGAVRCDTVRYGTVRYGAVRYGTVRYGTVRCGAVRWFSLFCMGRFLVPGWAVWGNGGTVRRNSPARRGNLSLPFFFPRKPVGHRLGDESDQFYLSLHDDQSIDR